MRRILDWLKKYFIPHGENEYKPHFLRHESMLLFFVVIIVIELGFLVQVFIVFDKTKFLAAVLPAVLTTLTNEERAENDAPPLVQNDLLTKAAQLKAEDMATHGYFAHTSPEGKTPWYWFNLVNYRYIKAGENLAVNFFESSDVAKAWMNSPTHRENIVKKDYTEIGIGVAKGIYEGKNTVFVAQLFGTPIKVLAEENTAPAPTTPPIVAPKTTPPVTPPVVAVVPTITQPVVPAITPVSTQVLGEEKATGESQIKLFIEKVLASPRQYATYVFLGIALLIILALLLAIFIKYEIQHPIIIARGFALIAIIIFLLFVNIKVFHLETKVPTDSMSASVIAY